MGSIPFAAVQGGVAGVVVAPQRAPDAIPDPGAGAAQLGIARAAAIGHDIVDKFSQARNAVAVSNAVVDSSTELELYRGELDKDGDYAGRAAKFTTRMEQVRQAKLDKLNDGRARDDFNLQFNRVAKSMRLGVIQGARDEELQHFKLKLGENLDQLATQSVLARNPQERASLMQSADDAIVDAVKTNRLTAVQAHTLKRAYLGKVDGALASELIRQNPAGAIQALGDPEQFKYLDASQRVQLRSQAQQRSESLSAQARAELSYDVQEFTQALSAGAPVSQQDYEALRKRAGANSAIGTRLTKTWDFFQRVNVETADKNIPQLAAAIGRLTTGAPTTHDGYEPRKNGDGSLSTELSITVTDPRLNGGRPTNIPSLWRGKEVDQGEAIGNALRSGRSFPSFDTVDQATTAAEERSRQLAQTLQQTRAPSVQDLNVARALKTALDRKVAERDRDPAAYALKYYPTVNESLVQAQEAQQSGDALAQNEAPDLRNRAWRTMIEVQRSEGVPEHRISLLTHAQAEDIRNRVNSAQPQQQVDLVQGLREQYGEMWPRVHAQLDAEKKLAPAAAVIAALPQGANLPLATIAEAGKITDKQATEILGTKRIGTIDEAVRSQVTAMAGTMLPAPGGAETLATFQSIAEKVARLYVMRGADEASAARRATSDVFYDHWEVLDTLRVPKQGGQPVVPASAVRAMQSQVIDALPKMDLAVPRPERGMTEAAAKDALLRNVRSFGTWMTTADDKGMVLMAGPGLPVRFADGKPLIVPFDSVLAAAGNRAAQVNLSSRLQEGVDPGWDDNPLPAAGAPRWLQNLFLGDQDMRDRRQRNRDDRRRGAP